MRYKQLTVGVLLASLVLFGSVAGAERVVVDFWFGENVEAYIDTMQQIVERFNAEHPSVYVDMSLHGTIQGDKLDQLKVSIAGGVPPDLAYLDGTAILELGLGSGMFIPLNELLDDEVIGSFNYLPVPTDEFQYEGIWYGLPFRTDSRGLYLNEDHFHQAGLDPRAPFATLADVDEAAEKLTVRDGEGNVVRLGWAPNGNNNGGELPWLWLFGGKLYDWETHRPALVGDANNIKALEWMLHYADRYGASAATGQGRFLAGTSSMLVNSTTRLTQYGELAPELNWWVAQIPPVEEGGEVIVLSTVLGVAVPLGAKHAEAAAEFILYLNRPEVQEFWYENTRSVPAHFDAFRAVLSAMDDQRELNMVMLLPQAKGYPPLFAYFTRPIFQSQVAAMRRREITPEQVLENTQRTAWPRYEEVFPGR